MLMDAVAPPLLLVIVGALFEAPTLMVTVSAWLVVPSETTTMNCNVVAEPGAVKVGDAAVELLSVTFGPSICVHW